MLPVCCCFDCCCFDGHPFLLLNLFLNLNLNPPVQLRQQPSAVLNQYCVHKHRRKTASQTCLNECGCVCVCCAKTICRPIECVSLCLNIAVEQHHSAILLLLRTLKQVSKASVHLCVCFHQHQATRTLPVHNPFSRSSVQFSNCDAHKQST